jgi:transcriptional regulator with XRE-family HTH domain
VKPSLGRAVAEQGRLIRAARKRAGLTLQKACRSLDISVAFLSDVERGRRLISPARLGDIARTFGCTVDDIGGPRHLSRDLVLWLRDQPDVVAVLVEAMQTGRVVVLAPDRPCPQCHRAPSRDCTFGRCKADEPRDTIEAPPVEAGRSE